MPSSCHHGTPVELIQNRHLVQMLHHAAETYKVNTGKYPVSNWQKFDQGTKNVNTGVNTYTTTYQNFIKSNGNDLAKIFFGNVLIISDLPSKEHLSEDGRSILDAYGEPIIHVSHPRTPLNDNNKDGVVDYYDCGLDPAYNEDVRSYYLPTENPNVLFISPGPDGLFSEIINSDLNLDNVWQEVYEK